MSTIFRFLLQNFSPFCNHLSTRATLVWEGAFRPPFTEVESGRGSEQKERKSWLVSSTNEEGATSCKNCRNRKSRGHTRRWWTNPTEGSKGWADDGIEVLANYLRTRESRVYTGWKSQAMSYQTRRCRPSTLCLYHVFMTCFSLLILYGKIDATSDTSCYFKISPILLPLRNCSLSSSFTLRINLFPLLHNLSHLI